MPTKFKISNHKERVRKLRPPLGGEFLVIQPKSQVIRYLREEDVAAYNNTSGITVEALADAPLPDAKPAITVAEAISTARTKTISREELHAASKAGSAAKSKPDKKPATTGDDE